MSGTHGGFVGALQSVTAAGLLIFTFGCSKGEGGDGSGVYGGHPGSGMEEGDDDSEDEDDDGQDGDDDSNAGDDQDGNGDPPPPADPPGNDPGLGSCCDASAVGGCNDAAVQNCVCASDAFCCENQWDDTCVQMIEDEGCGTCPGAAPPPADPPADPPAPPPADPPPPVDPPADPPPPVDSPCCTEQPGPGCAADPALEACVCGADPFCCEVLWDDVCLETAHLACKSCC